MGESFNDAERVRDLCNHSGSNLVVVFLHAVSSLNEHLFSHALGICMYKTPVRCEFKVITKQLTYSSIFASTTFTCVTVIEIFGPVFTAN